MIGRGAFAIFLGIAALAVAQVAWWIYFLVRIGGDQRHVVMFATEGAFFMVVLLLGVWLMYRTLAEQVQLRSMRVTFLSAVTHELKSPIAAIRLFLETIAEDRVDAAKRKDLVRKMLLDTDRLERLVSDLLRAGQIEAHALVPALEELDVRTVIEDLVERARLRLGPEDRIEADLPERPLIVRADRDLLVSAVENLIENAIKYSGTPRRIEVIATEGLYPHRDGAVHITVTDSGTGLDAATAARAFEPFSRGGDEMTRATKGTGLGLFIVRGIAEAHGGRAYIEGGRPVIALPGGAA